MTQEDKELLLKDLCVRLPYKPMIRLDFQPGHGYQIGEMGMRHFWDIVRHFEDGIITAVKPYLRPISSITEEESKMIDNISNKGKGFEEDEDGWIRCDSIHTKWGVWPDGCAKLLDYLNSIHVDYRGLIPMGLALEAPEDMYKTN